MSLLTPVKVPVKVYRWDDAGAPVLDKTPGCMMTIFKACLVTGYGTKEGAGWTMPFEDAATGVKVFRPPLSPETDFYLRCSSDTGKEMTAQVYLNMTDASTGDLKLQCATPFKYGYLNISQKWIVIATEVGFWFLTEGDLSRIPIENGGIYFYFGNIASASASASALLLQHTGGSWGIADADRYPITSTNQGGNNYGVVLAGGRIYTVLPSAYFMGDKNSTTEVATMQLMYLFDGKIFCLPAYGSSRNDTVNKTIISDGAGRRLMCHSTALNQNNNIYIPVDYWMM